MAPLGVALIGSGIFVKEEHLPAVKAASSVLTLKAIYSRSLKSAQGVAADAAGDVDLYSDEQGSKNYDELLKRDDIAGVIIALPIPVQPEYIKKALAAGKHVLAEKPIAKDVATAQDLISHYRSTKSQATLAIAENFRFLDSYVYAASQIKSLGRLLGFRLRMQTLVKQGSKWYETEWRKKPEYQGGFLLDGGVHFVAGMRFVLDGAGVKPVRTSAYTTLLQDHLPPVDTVNGAIQLSDGTSGSVAISFGTTFSGSEWAFAAEKGTLVVDGGKVVIKRTGEDKEEEKSFPDEANGVGQEVLAWGKGIAEGKVDPRQEPEQALGDLEILQAFLTSGEQNGAPIDLKLQG